MLSYDHKLELSQKVIPYRWGYEIERLEEHFEGFKLGLEKDYYRHDEHDLTRRHGFLSQFSSGSTRYPTMFDDSVQLSTDYLTALNKRIEWTLLQKIPEKTLTGNPKEYIITVPAWWSDQARASIFSCFIEAGMGSPSTLHIVSESEAAAVYALMSIDTHGLQVRDSFIVCDAGGEYAYVISISTSLAAN